MTSKKVRPAESMTVEGAGSRGAEYLKEVRGLLGSSPEVPKYVLLLHFMCTK